MAKDPVTGQIGPWNDNPQRWIDGSVDNDLPMSRLSEMFNVNHFIVSQVNPHVVPFIPQEEYYTFAEGNRSWSLESGWLRSLTGLAREEALHRMYVLSELGIFPNTLRKVASVMSQKYSGNINILPQITYELFPNILKNPTTNFMLQACISGERATWPKLGRIRNHCAIELALDRAVQIMRARVTFNPIQNGSVLKSINYRWDEISGNNNRVRANIRYRRSHGGESDRIKAGQFHALRRPVHHLRKTRSSVSTSNAGLGILYPHMHNDTPRNNRSSPRRRHTKRHSANGFIPHYDNHAVVSGSEDESKDSLKDSQHNTQLSTADRSPSPDVSSYVHISSSPWMGKNSPVMKARRNSGASKQNQTNNSSPTEPAKSKTPSPKQDHRRKFHQTFESNY